jgi:hypothetical protein
LGKFGSSGIPSHVAQALVADAKNRIVITPARADIVGRDLNFWVGLKRFTACAPDVLSGFLLKLIKAVDFYHFLYKKVKKKLLAGLSQRPVLKTWGVS